MGRTQTLHAFPVRDLLDRRDADLQQEAADALRTRSDIPSGIDASARDGVITLSGSVAWAYQKTAAEQVVSRLCGVGAVDNQLVVNTTVSPREVRNRMADLDLRAVEIEIRGRIVTLSGRVRSAREKHDAERAAWRAPGVAGVRNRLDVVP